MKPTLSERQVRLKKANEFIEFIATHGRKFFGEGSKPSRFEFDMRQRLWFVDSYTNERIYLHYEFWGKGFSNGGTMRRLVNCLKKWILQGQQPPRNLFKWPDWYGDGDLWGYGADMPLVLEKAVELGILEEATLQ